MTRLRCLLQGVVACLLLGGSVEASATPLFTGLGDLPNGGFSSQAFDVSGDGSVVVGSSTSRALRRFGGKTHR